VSGFAERATGPNSIRTDRIRLLFFVREPFPTYRVDVEVLFGQELLKRGHIVDLVMQAADESVEPGARNWHGRTAWIGRTDLGSGAVNRIRKHLLGILHDLRCLAYATPERYDAIQVRDKFLTAAVALLVARVRRVKFFYWLSWPHPEALMQRGRNRSARYPLLTWARGWASSWLLYRCILRYCDHAFVQSEKMRRDIAARGVPYEKLTAVAMGIAAEDVSPPRSERVAADVSSAQSMLTIGYLGTLNSNRRLEILVDALSLLRDRGLNARLLIVGDGDTPEDRQRLVNWALELHVADRVEITGFLPRPQALERIGSVDICVSPFASVPPLDSASPTKLVEYLALGIPVVASAHPEQTRVLRACRAGLCVPWSARAFARAIRWLAGRTAAERGQMGDRGRRWIIENRTYDRIADVVEQVYQRELERGARLAQ
jgi:glycosyltransferase involved in cell wall biosynthesis